MTKRNAAALQQHYDVELGKALAEYGVPSDTIPSVKKELIRVRREMEDRDAFEIPDITAVDPVKRQHLVQVLIRLATQGTTITYQDLALELGLPSAGNALAKCLVPYLSNVFFWCKARQLPHLTSLVVRKSGTDKGLPGPGFWDFMGTGVTKIGDKRFFTDIYHKEVYAFFAPL